MTYTGTPAEAAALLVSFTSNGSPTAIMNGMRNWVRQVQRETVTAIRSKGVGRALWGVKGKGARLMVKTVRVKRAGDTYRSGVDLQGLAALMETGGKTKKHVITGNLSFPGTNKYAGNIVVTKRVNHPGSKIPATPSLGPTYRRLEPKLRDYVDAALVKAAGKLVA